MLARKFDVLEALRRPPDGALPLWLFDRLHPLDGIAPTAPTAAVTAVERSAEVARVQAEYDVLAIAARIRHAPPVAMRWKVTPPEERPSALTANILAAGERLGWPGLSVRPGERLATGETAWRAFLAQAPVDRPDDPERALGPAEGKAP